MAQRLGAHSHCEIEKKRLTQWKRQRINREESIAVDRKQNSRKCFNTELPYVPQFLLVGGIHSRKVKTYVYIKCYSWMFIAASFITAKKVKATQISINRWTNEQNVIYSYNGKLFGNGKEWSADTCYSVNEPWKYYAKVEEAMYKRPHVVMIPFIWNVGNRQIHTDRK